MVDLHDEHEHDALMERLRGGVTGIHPGHSALEGVHRQVHRRRRRRRVVGAVATVAVVAVAVPVVLSVVDLAPSDVEPAKPEPTAVVDGTRPAAFFRQSLDQGRVRAQLTRFNAARQERYYSRFVWFPELEPEDNPNTDPDADPVLAGAAVEQYDGDAADTCEEYVQRAEEAGGTASCVEVDGGVARLAEVASADHFLDLVHERGRLVKTGRDDAVNTATVFRDDGWAVTLTVCSCAPGNRSGRSEAPSSPALLAEAAAMRDWVVDP